MLASSITPRPWIRISASTGRTLVPTPDVPRPGRAKPVSVDQLQRTGQSSRGPRHPCTGSSNLRTRRSVNGLLLQPHQPHRRAGTATTSTREPAGSSTGRRPSQHSTAGWPVRVDLHGHDRRRRRPPAGGRTGRARCSAPPAAPRTSGHITGPPAENAYAVEPVGVAHSTPSQPNADTGRPSTSTHHVQHPLPAALLHAGLVQRPRAGDDLARRSLRRDVHASSAPRRGSRRSTTPLHGLVQVVRARPRPGSRPGPG